MNQYTFQYTMAMYGSKKGWAPCNIKTFCGKMLKIPRPLVSPKFFRVPQEGGWCRVGNRKDEGWWGFLQLKVNI